MKGPLVLHMQKKKSKFDVIQPPNRATRLVVVSPIILHKRAKGYKCLISSHMLDAILGQGSFIILITSGHQNVHEVIIHECIMQRNQGRIRGARWGAGWSPVTSWLDPSMPFIFIMAT